MSGFRSSFRKSVQNDTKKSGKGRGGKGFYEKLKIQKTDTGTPLLLIRGEYQDLYQVPDATNVDPRTGQMIPSITPYKKYRKHVRKFFKNGKEQFPDEICSAGPEQHNPQPCVGCFAIDTGDKSVSISDAFAIGVVHLVYYHGHPMIDRQTGQFVQKQDKSYVIIYDECEGRTCNFCRVLAGQPPVMQQGDPPFPQYPQGTITTEFGRRRYLDLGKNHLGNILAWDETIGRICGNCRAELLVDGFACASCNQLVIDMANDPRTDDQIKEVISQPMQCQRCGQVTMLNEVVGCQTCEFQGVKPLQLGVFDVVTFATKQGEGTSSVLALGPRQFTTLADFGRTVDPRFLNGKTFEQYIADLAKPYDFDSLLSPRTLKEQSDRLSLPVPGGPPAGAPVGGFSAYPPGFAQPGVQQPAYPPPGFAAPPQGGATPAPYNPYPAQAPTAAPVPGVPRGGPYR